jgi:serine/threonine-protein kinase
MDNQHFRKVNELFDGALKLPASERSAFLKQQCGDDQALFDDVLALLDADMASQVLLDGVAASAIDVPADQLANGDEVGPYRIAEKLGTGGMGDVYLADRADGHFDQRVALKLIKRGMDTDEILRRFASERQILAGLQHPNIAQLLDGGTTDDGRPFYAMEYVEGEPITKYCDRLRLSIDDRLKLFVKVCDAVRYAQQRLVIHRDLKPSNIMVTEEGRVKLLDFGIAKVLTPETDDAPGMDLTRTGMRIMTPAYASPEQMQGERVTTAADVYSLGVVLYELLSGRRPIRIEGLSPQQAEQAVASTEPSKPSTELMSDPSDPKRPSDESTPEEIVRLRNTDLAHLRKRLSGDLDNICLMALRKEADRRYSSAGELMEDIERHIHGLPVHARPDTTAYRLSKFWQRHRLAVSAATAVLFLTIGLVAYYTIQLALERDKARLEADKATAVSEFLAELFELADPNEVRGEQLTAREMLDLGVERVRTELVDQLDIQSEMFLVMANTFRNLGLYGEAATLIEDALEVRLELYGERHEDVATAYSRLADILYYDGKFDSSQAIMLRNLELKRDLLGDNHAEVALELNNLGWIAYELGDLTAAESLYNQSLAIRRFSHEPDHPDIAESISNLASVAYSRGEFELSERMNREAMDMRIRVLGENHPDVAMSLNNLGLALEELERYQEAEECYNRNIEIYRELHGEGHQMADAYTFRGRINTLLGLYQRAEADYRKAVDLRRGGLGDDHYLVGYDLKSLGNSLEFQKKYAAADSAFGAALSIYRRAFPEGNAYTSSALLGKGRTMVYLGDPIGAESLLREGLALRERDLSDDNWALHFSRSHLAWCLSRLGRFEEAEPMLLKAYSRMLDQLGQDDSKTKQVASRLAELYEAWDKPDLFAHYSSLAERPSQ